SREEAVAHRLDRATAMTLELATHQRVVALDQLPPAAVAKARGGFRGTDDVGEHHRRQHAIDRRNVALAGEELLDLVDNRVGVARDEEVILAVELNEARSADAFRDVASQAERHDSVAAAVQDQGGQGYR